MRLTAIVLAHDQLAMTRRCLQALAAAVAGIDHEVLCVDNASAEDLSVLTDNARAFDRFELRRNERNLSFSTANNLAAACATGDCLLFLNNDVVVGEGSVRALCGFLRSRPEAAVAGAKLVYPDGNRLQHAGMEQMLWGVASNYGVGASRTDERFSDSAQRFAVTGAMLCIRRQVFDALGGFDEAYSWGYEDVDLCLKTRAAGRQVWYVAGAEAVHAESVTLRSRRRVEDVERNYAAYRKRWDGVLVPAERAYISRMEDAAIRRVAIFGTGAAARALCRTLQAAGIQVVAFTSTTPEESTVDGIPILRPVDLGSLSFDRLMAGTQFFFEIESQLRCLDPRQEPLFPVLQTQWPA